MTIRKNYFPLERSLGGFLNSRGWYFFRISNLYYFSGISNYEKKRGKKGEREREREKGGLGHDRDLESTRLKNKLLEEWRYKASGRLNVVARASWFVLSREELNVLEFYNHEHFLIFR